MRRLRLLYDHFSLVFIWPKTCRNYWKVWVIFAVLVMKNKNKNAFMIHPKGRPRTARITSAIEGLLWGGGEQGMENLGCMWLRSILTSRQSLIWILDDDEEDGERAAKHHKKVFKCSICWQPGHCRDKCPFIP
ncbi:hypothetical protein BT96DRAFT_1023952 [Gymnopus androsaceus JB14]|uniref:Uncharacterized protein n=1 Tax=Gymnopus androsaceus JB14 TaxID=1447944 RepID=A0A6A4H1Z3_9AGAR|nr:hypothetical protein BT96DRAFT_1023952 [Gymnopus androsaceus JB14]